MIKNNTNEAKYFYPFFRDQIYLRRILITILFLCREAGLCDTQTSSHNTKSRRGGDRVSRWLSTYEVRRTYGDIVLLARRKVCTKNCDVNRTKVGTNRD